MPYFITDNAEGCAGWAMIKDDGEILGCHTTKQAAIDQMIAVSLAENITPGGERKGNQMTKVETRTAQVQDFEIRADGDSASFRGYAAVFNSDSEPLPFIEQIRPGAFQRSLQSRNQIKMFMNHNDDIVLGSTRAGTLRLQEDGRGLVVDADLPDTTAGRDLKVLMQRGDIDSMSFGFSVPRGGDEWSDNGERRYLNECRLHEVSVVSGFPAYEATSAIIRKAELLARKTEQDQDAIADALTALESGSLNNDQADLIVSIVDRVRPEPEPEAPNLDLIKVLQDKLELLAKAI